MAVLDAPAETRTCSHCKRTLPLTTEFFYRNGLGANGAWRFKALCIPCRRQERAGEAARRTEQEWKAKRARDRARKRRDADLRKLDDRLRREREGVELRPSGEAPGRVLPNLPVAPMLAKLMGLLAQRNGLAGLCDIGTGGVGNISAICKQLGFAERTLLAWRTGERKTTEFDTVDKILVRAGWLWFDVYNERTVVLPDGSTDWETLARVEHDFTCEGCAACKAAAEKSEKAREYAAQQAVAA